MFEKLDVRMVCRPLLLKKRCGKFHPAPMIFGSGGCFLQQEVTIRQRSATARANGGAASARRFIDRFAMQHAAAQIKHAFESTSVVARKVERNSFNGNILLKWKWQRNKFGIFVAIAHRRSEFNFRIRQVYAFPVIDSCDEKIALRSGQRAVKTAADAEIAISDRKQAFHLPLALVIESFLFDAPGNLFLMRLKGGIQQMNVYLRQILHHHVCAGILQRGCVVAAVYANDKSEPTTSSGLNAGHGILENHRMARRNAERLPRIQEHVGKQQTQEPQPAKVDAIQACVEEIRNAGGQQHLAAMPA